MEKEKTKTFDSVIQEKAKLSLNDILGSIVNTTKLSKSLPMSQDGTFEMYSSNEDFQQFCNKSSQRVSAMLEKLCHSITPDININDSEDIDFRRIADISDYLLEKADICLDEHTGVRQKSKQINLTKQMLNKEAIPQSLTDKKPQKEFENKIDNFQLYQPKLKEKPFAITPIELSIRIIIFNVYLYIESSYEIIDGDIDYVHPYLDEITQLELMPSQLLPHTEIEPLPIDETPLHYIDNVEEFNRMLENLNNQKEIAIDLEYHSYRSYQGFTCLMQISTRKEDYIIDTISLRSICYKLNNIFCNPSIIKVFHGSNQDILWLQKDFGVYVVNMFDTYQASVHLLLDKHSYASLVLRYCKINLDKTNQLADWRERPLSDDKILYARNDTHYLLYVYDCMVKELYDKSEGENNDLV